MKEDVDVLIVGGGAVGLFCAEELLRRGRSVTIVERGAFGGPQSCSSGNTGFVGTTGSAPLAQPGVLVDGIKMLFDPKGALRISPRLDAGLFAWIFRFVQLTNAEKAAACSRVLLALKRRSLAIFDDLCADDPQLAGHYRRDARLIVFKTRSVFEKAMRDAERANGAGGRIDILDARQTCAAEPVLAPKIAGALLNHEDAHLILPQFFERMAGRLKEHGAVLSDNVEVNRFVADRGRVTAVETDKGTFRPCDLVLATGADAPSLLRTIGIKLLLQPAKGHTVTFSAANTPLNRSILLSEGRVAVSPMGERIRCGGQLEIGTNSTVPSAARVKALLEVARSYIPSLGDEPVLETWAGARPCAPDSLPFVGTPEGIANLMVATGGGNIGIGLAPAMAELAAQALSGEPSDLERQPLRVNRFGGGTRGVLSAPKAAQPAAATTDRGRMQ